MFSWRVSDPFYSQKKAPLGALLFWSEESEFESGFDQTTKAIWTINRCCTIRIFNPEDCWGYSDVVWHFVVVVSLLRLQSVRQHHCNPSNLLDWRCGWCSICWWFKSPWWFGQNHFQILILPIKTKAPRGALFFANKRDQIPSKKTWKWVTSSSRPLQ